VTVNGVVAPILRYFTEFGSFRGALRKSGWRCRRKKVHVRYLISWWVSYWKLQIGTRYEVPNFISEDRTRSQNLPKNGWSWGHQGHKKWYNWV